MYSDSKFLASPWRLMMSALLMLSTASSLHATSQIRLLKDINPKEVALDDYQISQNVRFFYAGGALYFLNTEPEHGQELWIVKPAANEARLLLDAVPGTLSDTYSLTMDGNPKDLFYFFLKRADGRLELWRSNSSETGTFMLKSFPTSTLGVHGKILAAGNDAYFVPINPANNHKELWKTDGTIEGTILVKDLSAIPNFSSVDYIIESNGILYMILDFFASSPYQQLWRSDGTASGTVKVTDFVINGMNLSHATNLIPIGDKILFLADFYPGYLDLGSWDGNQIVQLTQVNSTMIPSPIKELMLPAGDKLFFFTEGLFMPGSKTITLARSDGTVAGTIPVSNFSSILPYREYITKAFANGKIYFIFPYAMGDPTLWQSNGTEAGSGVVMDDQGKPLTSVYNITGTLDGLYFSRYNLHAAFTLMKLNATGEQLLLKDFAGKDDLPLQAFTPMGSSLAFTYNVPSLRRELWTSDGTSEGTRPWMNIFFASRSAAPANLTVNQGVLYFNADDGVHGAELWRCDGTEAGTFLLRDCAANATAGNPQNLTPWGMQTYFTAHDGSGVTLWLTDGSESGTRPILGYDGGNRMGNPKNLSLMGDRLFFSGETTTSGKELWQSEGTSSTTKRVCDIAGGIQSSDPAEITGLEKIILFSAANDGVNRELWKSDGSDDGTTQVLEINPGLAASNPNQLTRLEDEVLFSANCPSGQELWRSDGTTSGTILVCDINAGTSSSTPLNMQQIRKAVYFSADDGIHGRELWRSDGTSSGTVMVKDIALGASSSPGKVVVMGDHFYFSADDGAHGSELWCSDGTSTGTILLCDLSPGSASSSPRGLIVINDLLYFIANDDVHGTQWWHSDGTSEGTQPLKFEGISPNFSGLSNIAALRDRLYFVMDNNAFGREIWELAPGPLERANARKAWAGYH